GGARAGGRGGAARLEVPGFGGLGERDRNRGRPGIAVAFEVHPEGGEGDPQPLGHAANDASVSLVGEHPAEPLGSNAGLTSGCLECVRHGINGRATHLGTLHRDLVAAGGEGYAVRRPGGSAVRHEQIVGPTPVATEVHTEEARAPAEDHGSRTVTEQDGGRPIIPVDVTREAVGSYQEDVPGRSRRERLVGKREPVDEAGAGGIEIERGDWTRAELRLHETGRRRDGVVRRGGGRGEGSEGVGGEARAGAGS